jgi:hypothetical protein
MWIILVGEICAYDKKNPTSQMQYIDYGLGVFHDSAFAAIVDSQPHDLADLYRDFACTRGVGRL